MGARWGMGPEGLRYPWQLLWSIRYSVLLGRTVARCHVADAGAITPDVIIHDVEEAGGSIARHPHKLRRERVRR